MSLYAKDCLKCHSDSVIPTLYYMGVKHVKNDVSHPFFARVYMYIFNQPKKIF